MNRGVDRQPVFFHDADRLDFGRQLAWIHEHVGGSVLAYCLMGNHYHLLLDMPEGSLSGAMHHLGSVFTRHVNDRLGRDGPLFRGRFHSIPVEDDAYLLTAVRYVHRNPLALPGVSGPADHRWSSYRAYVGLRPAPTFLDTTRVMDLLGGSVARLEALTEDRSDGAAAGLGLRVPASPSAPASVTEVRSVLRCALALEDLEHGREADRPPQGLERTVLVLLADQAGDDSLRRSLSAHLGTRSPDAARLALGRARARERTDPRVRRLLTAVEAYLAPARAAPSSA